MTSTTTLQRIAHLVLVGLALFAIGLALPGVASAERKSPGELTAGVAQRCRDAGGTPDVTISVSPSGYKVYVIECKGGGMDGQYCFIAEDFSYCDTRGRLFGNNSPDYLTDDLEVAPDPVVAEPEIVNEIPVEEVAPIVAEPTATATPGPIVDPVVDEPIVVDPVVDDGEVAPDPTPEPGTDGGRDIGPGIDLDPILIEPIVEPIDVVLL